MHIRSLQSYHPELLLIITLFSFLYMFVAFMWYVCVWLCIFRLIQRVSCCTNCFRLFLLNRCSDSTILFHTTSCLLTTISYSNWYYTNLYMYPPLMNMWTSKVLLLWTMLLWIFLYMFLSLFTIFKFNFKITLYHKHLSLY